MRKFFVGIDVQVRSNSPYAVLDDDLNFVKSVGFREARTVTRLAKMLVTS